jgi:hypothetical protein
MDKADQQFLYSSFEAAVDPLAVVFLAASEML